ncbi:FAD-dependent thymidylate synthase [Candidatus Bathyarchaeota archaeon]|nr:FAD-dependent thymidylate synthase [Candidatus Bathyarchaeota archaeon]
MVKYVDESFEILTQIDGTSMLKQVERAGRSCYKSEDHITRDSHLKFARMLVNRQHFSVIEHCSVSVRIISNRGLTHELVRHRIASYSQESTRYCNYRKGKFGNQITVIDQSKHFKDAAQVKAWKHAMEDAEKHYMGLIEAGTPAEIARGVLPIDVKTEIVITANLREWRHIFTLRCSPAAHPNIRHVMGELLNEFKSRIPVIFDDINP